MVDRCPWPGGIRPMKGFLVFACSGNIAYHLWQKKKKSEECLLNH